MPGPLSSTNAALEAARRIQSAGEAGRERLDLSTRFRWLRHIPDLGKSFPTVKFVSLYGTSITDLSGIEQFPNLEHIEIRSLKVKDATLLGTFANLRTVDADWSRIQTIALHPDAPLEELELRRTGITSLSFLGARPTLRVLRLSQSKVASLDGIELCPNLEILQIDSTEVSSVDELAALSRLSWLSIARTSVSDIGPLSSLFGLQHLDLQLTQVEDLSPIRGLVNLRDGEGGFGEWGETWQAGVHFRGTPLTDKTLRMMADLPDATRTKHVFEHLNDAGAAVTEEREAEPPFPPENLPSQGARGFGFAASDGGPIELNLDDAAQGSDGQADLHAELAIQVAETLAAVAKSDNAFPGLNDDVERYASALGDSVDAVSLRALWARGNKLRLWLQADARRRANGDDQPPLSAGTSASLTALVQTHNVFIMGDPVGRECDSLRLGPEGRASAAEVIAAFRPLLDQLADRTDVVSESALEALDEATSNGEFAATSNSVDAEQAKSFALNTIGNFSIELVRRAYVSGIRALRNQTAITTIKEGFLQRLGGVPIDLAVLGTGASILVFATSNAVTINNILVRLPGLELLGQALRWLGALP